MAHEMAVTFDILKMHGVDDETVALLSHWFGSTFPKPDINGPGHAMVWALEMLPWSRLHPLLREWLEDAAKHAELTDDPFIQAILAQLVDEPDKEASGHAQAHAFEMAAAVAVDEGFVKDHRLDLEELAWAPEAGSPSLRTWCGAVPVASAAHMATEKGHDEDLAEATYSAAAVLARQSTKTYAVDRAMQRIYRELASYVRGWSGPRF